MSLRLCSYNIEWFNRLFSKDNNLGTSADDQKRLAAIRDVLRKLKADVIGVVEAPNTTKSQSESTIAKLEAFASWAGLSTTKALTGIISAGQQELALLYDPKRVSVAHSPGGDPNRVSNPPFDGVFLYDTDDDRIKEQYKFYRPPLEVSVSVKPNGPDFRLMVVHPKSKGIFNSVDLLHWERESQRNRRKLYAECTWIRNRVDEWLDDNHQVVVMGDINDGPNMDYYEFQFSRSAVEIVIGDLFEPERILRSFTGRPRWGAHGWKPASARYRDRMTGDYVNVLIDHILASQGVQVVAGSHKIWNPYEDDDANELREALNEASDHYPVTLDLA